MINTGKNTGFLASMQTVAGVLPSDPGYEFVGIPETQKVLWLHLGNEVLTWRDLLIIDMIKKEYTDEHIADELGITTMTLNYHKKRLYNKAGVQTKAGLINVVNQEKI